MKYIELKWFLLLLALIILFLIGEEIFVYFGDPTSNFFFLFSDYHRHFVKSHWSRCV